MKRFLALFLAVCLCFGCVPVTHVHAEEVEGDPQAENSWRYENGEIIDEGDLLPEIEESVEAPDVFAFYPSEKKALGIDVSEHQGSINWTNVKNAGIQFAIIRCGYGQNQTNQDDDYFLQNIKGANDAGIPFGLYLYNYAKTTSGASGEADHAIRLINVAKQYSQFKLPMYYDLEENSVYALSNATVLAMAQTFHDRVEAATGWPVGVYANTSWFNNKLTDSWYQSQPLWVAQYNTSCQYNGKYDIWQYSSSGSVNGISGRVDMNYARVPVSTLCSYTTSGTSSAKATLVTDKNTYVSREAIWIDAYCDQAGSWVGIYPKGKSVSDYLLWYRLKDNEGNDAWNNWQFNLFDAIHTTPNRGYQWNDTTKQYMDDHSNVADNLWGALLPGTYRLGVFTAGNQEIVGKDITITAASNLGSASITTNKKTYAVGEMVYVTANGTVDMVDSWVGFYPASVTSYPNAAYAWYYTYNKSKQPVSIWESYEEWKDGSPWPVPAGKYKVVLFSSGYNVVNSVEITIVDDSTATVSTNANTYCVEQNILVSTNYSAEDAWVGLYKNGETYGEGGVTSLYWYWLSEGGTSNANIFGYHNERGDYGAGTYKIYLFKDSGYNKIAEKTVTVVNCTDGNKDHKCDYCGGTVSSCNANNSTVNSKYLKSAANCTSAAVYYKSCSVCGGFSTGNATFTSGSPDTSNHVSGCTLTWTTKNQTHHEQKYSKCGTSKVAYATHTWKNGVCSVCSYTCTHTGGTATCTAKPVCTNCGVSYGSVNATNHTASASWTTKNATQHESKYSCCDATAVTLENHEWADGVCAECGYTCEHVDKNEKDHVCDTCSKVLGACKDEDNNNKCDYCGATMCEHEGGKADCQTSAICSKCGKPYGPTDPSNHTGAPEWTKTNDTHKQAYSCCGAVTVEEDSHVDEDEADHKCDICDKVLGECSDKTGDGDHKCDVCGKDNITDCADKADDKDHKCDECGKDNMNECVDTDPADHKCDICDKVLGQCKDENNDNKCDHCGETMCEHKDENKDHNCDTCGKPVSDHKDENKDHNCDTCGKPVSDHKDENNDNKCDHCGETMCEHKDENKDHNCDLCEKPLSDCQDENKDHKCDTCDKTLSECKDEDKDYKCDICDKDLDKPAPEVGSDRLAGEDRFDTAFIVANKMKEELGVEKFNTIIVASGKDFADALSGSYLAAVKNAPILLSYKDKQNQQVMEYIRLNLAKGGIVYILGGTKAVPESMEKALSDLNVKRLAGENRFDTNTEILKEVGVPADETVLVCTGTDFADCLSGSAVGKPIMLVYKKLMDSQKKFLPTLDNDFCIIGGENAVNKNIETTLQKYGEVERLAGAHRYETSVLVAEKFFQDPDSAVLAYAKNYPDGLCGGALAVTKGAPLLLTDSKYFSFAAEYAKKNGISFGVVLGGKKLISDKAVEAIFGE